VQHIFAQLVRSDDIEYRTDDPQENFETLRIASEYNQLIADWWKANAEDLDVPEAESEWAWYRPSGYVFPLHFSSDYIDISGPDIF